MRRVAIGIGVGALSCSAVAFALLGPGSSTTTPTTTPTTTTTVTSTTVSPTTTSTASPYPTAPFPDPPVRVAGVGTPAEMWGLTITVTRLEFDPCVHQDYQAAPGNTFAVLTFTMANHSDSFIGSGSWELWLWPDGAEEAYGPLPSEPSCRGYSSGVIHVAPGQQVGGDVSFQMPGHQRYNLVARWVGDADRQADFEL